MNTTNNTRNTMNTKTSSKTRKSMITVSLMLCSLVGSPMALATDAEPQYDQVRTRMSCGNYYVVAQVRYDHCIVTATVIRNQATLEINNEQWLAEQLQAQLAQTMNIGR
jgi:starvation-inducible outer membrane lipoprotein